MWISRKENAKKKRQTRGRGTSFDDGNVAFLPRLSWVILLMADRFCEIILACSGASCVDSHHSWRAKVTAPATSPPGCKNWLKWMHLPFIMYSNINTHWPLRESVLVFFCPSFLSNKLIPLAVLHINGFSRTNSFQTVVSQTSKSYLTLKSVLFRWLTIPFHSTLCCDQGTTPRTPNSFLAGWKGSCNFPNNLQKKHRIMKAAQEKLFKHPHYARNCSRPKEDAIMPLLDTQGVYKLE